MNFCDKKHIIIAKDEWYIFCNVELNFTDPGEMLYMLVQDFEKLEDIACL